MVRKRKIKINLSKQTATIATITTVSMTVESTAQAQTNSIPPGMKMLELPHGIPNVSLKQVERMVPIDEPPALKVNAELEVIGKRTPRIDAQSKVTGRARYTSDVRLPGMLYGRGYVSPYPHARVLSVDTSAAEKYPGVRAVYIFTALTGYAKERDPGHINPQETKTTEGKFPTVRFVGQPIAAVAAISQEAADAAAQLIRVKYEPLPYVCEMEAARKPDAPVIFSTPLEQEGTGGGGGAVQGLQQRGNVRGPNTGGKFNGPRGDIKQGFAQADVTVEGVFRAPF